MRPTYTLTLALLIILTSGISLVFAWTGPTQTPPGGNVSAPINIGATDQVKNGNLGVNGLSVYPNWNPAQAIAINGNQIYKSVTTGDANLYLQYSCEGCGTVIGDGIGAANNLYVRGDVRSTSGEIIGDLAGGYGQFRMIGGNYGAFFRNDGAHTYLLLTNSGDQYGIWNSLRPFYVNNVSGDVAMAHNVTVGGSVTASSFLYSSDLVLKKDIKSLINTERILAIEPKIFTWKESGKEDVGVIAQDVEALFPEFVHETAGGYKAVDYAKLVVPLLGVVREQQKEIDELKARLDTAGI